MSANQQSSGEIPFLAMRTAPLAVWALSLHSAASQRQGGNLHFSALNVTSDSKEGLSRALKEASKHVSSIVEQKLHVNVCSLLVYLLQVPWLAQIYPYL